MDAICISQKGGGVFLLKQKLIEKTGAFLKKKIMRGVILETIFEKKKCV